MLRPVRAKEGRESIFYSPQWVHGYNNNNNNNNRIYDFHFADKFKLFDDRVHLEKPDFTSFQPYLNIFA